MYNLVYSALVHLELQFIRNGSRKKFKSLNSTYIFKFSFYYSIVNIIYYYFVIIILLFIILVITVHTTFSVETYLFMLFSLTKITLLYSIKFLT